jgi:hypothetical protein
MLSPPKLIYYQRRNGQLTTYRCRLQEEVGVEDYNLVASSVNHKTYRYIKRISSEQAIDNRTPIFDQREPVRVKTEEPL